MIKKISVIIPVYNNPQGLSKTLASIKRLQKSPWEVIVVDDASTVSCEEICDSEGVRLLRLQENSGPGIARNEGARMATGELLAFTDSDCTVPPDWLSKIEQAMSDPSIAAVAGGYSDDHATTLVSWARCLEASYHHLHQRALVNSFITANFAIRRAVFEEAGAFPKEYFGEDLLFGIKLKEKGKSVLWLPDLRVGQYFRPTFSAYVKQQFHWSSAVALISVRYPQTQSLSWSVNRSVLLPQLLLEALLLASPLFLGGRILSVFLAMSAMGVLGFNLPFLAYVTRKKSLAKAIGVFFIVMFGRNPAWLGGCLWALVTHPGLMIPGLMKMVIKKLSPSVRTLYTEVGKS